VWKEKKIKCFETILNVKRSNYAVAEDIVLVLAKVTA